jgi:hypothetical protein
MERAGNDTDTSLSPRALAVSMHHLSPLSQDAFQEENARWLVTHPIQKLIRDAQQRWQACNEPGRGRGGHTAVQQLQDDVGGIIQAKRHAQYCYLKICCMRLTDEIILRPDAAAGGTPQRSAAVAGGGGGQAVSGAGAGE